jgi:ABC-2 type transport system permease protein
VSGTAAEAQGAAAAAAATATATATATGDGGQAGRTGTRAPVVRAGAWRQLVTLARAMLRGFFRDRTALFFTFFFPLMFLVIFGLIFNNAGAVKTTLGVVGSGPIISALPTQALELKTYPDEATALAAVRSGGLPGVLIESGSSLRLRYAASDQVKAATLNGIVGSVVDGVNVAASGGAPAYTLQRGQVEDASLKAIQYITPGILSWGVATSAAFGAALTLVSWRRTQLLRRLRLAPAPVWTVVGARVGVSLVVALVQAALFVGIALTPPFGLQLTGSWYLALPLLMAGTLAFLSVGLLVGSIARTDEAASAMVNFVVLPMAFLSGTFFDITAAPGWLQAVSKVLPLRWMNDGMLDILARGKGVQAIGLPILVLLAFGAVVSLIGARFFRWDDA